MKDLVMYSRTTSCPFVSLAKRVLNNEHVPYRELFIDQDKTVEQRVLTWTGFLSVPTLIVAMPGEDLPYEEPASLPKVIERPAEFKRFELLVKRPRP